MPETREIRSIGGTAEVSSSVGCSGVLGGNPLGRLGSTAAAATSAADGVGAVAWAGGGVGAGVGAAVGLGVGLGVGAGVGEVTVWVTPWVLAEPTKLPSPSYVAVIVWVPTARDRKSV